MILQRYIFRELVFTFVVAFAILVTVCAVGLIFNMFRTYEGVTLSFIFDALPMAFSFMAPWALLVASTLTATMVYGRLAAENEIDAMRTSGIHIGRIFAPAFLFAVFVFIFAFLVHHELGPRAKYKKRDIVGDTVIEVLRHPPPGQTNVKISNAYRLSYLEASEGILKQPTLASFDSEGNLKRLFYGSQGTIEVLSDRQVKITIQDSTLIEFEMVDGEPKEKGGGPTGKAWTVTLELENPYARPKTPEDMPGLELVSEWSRAKGGDRTGLYTEIHLRFAKSLGPVCLILLGVPIGILVKKGTKMSGLGVAIPPLLIYFVLFFLGQGLAQRNLVAPEVGAYGANLVVLVAAAVLNWKVLRV